MILRQIVKNEIDLLRDFLYEAIFIPGGVDPPPRDIIDQPELRLYYEGFGSGKADNAIVAEDDGKVVGAVWTRIMNDYGHVDDDTPSFAISLYKEYRGQGTGSELMKEMLLSVGIALYMVSKGYAAFDSAMVGLCLVDLNVLIFYSVTDSDYE